MTTKIELRETLGFAVSNSSRQLANALVHRFAKSGIQLTVEQWSVLNCLWRKDGICQHELAICSGKERPSMTRIIDGLEKRGMVERRASEADRRHNLIFLTPISKVLEPKVSETVRSFEAEIAQLFTEQELEVVSVFMQRIEQYFQQDSPIINH